MLANFFVLWLLLAVGGGFLLFFGGLLASWIGEEMVCFCWPPPSWPWPGR